MSLADIEISNYGARILLQPAKDSDGRGLLASLRVDCDLRFLQARRCDLRLKHAKWANFGPNFPELLVIKNFCGP